MISTTKLIAYFVFVFFIYVIFLSRNMIIDQVQKTPSIIKPCTRTQDEWLKFILSGSFDISNFNEHTFPIHLGGKGGFLHDSVIKIENEEALVALFKNTHNSTFDEDANIEPSLFDDVINPYISPNKNYSTSPFNRALVGEFVAIYLTLHRTYYECLKNIRLVVDDQLPCEDENELIDLISEENGTIDIYDVVDSAHGFAIEGDEMMHLGTVFSSLWTSRSVTVMLSYFNNALPCDGHTKHKTCVYVETSQCRE